MSAARLKARVRSLPPHVVLIAICALWLIPTIGLLVTSF
ncbi:MAG: carbohydrate ABC transporter permease, partial [Chloroflexi bacterium]|nr:carbohydrate ABC transporter permease [Chloroflexota bacterium]